MCFESRWNRGLEGVGKGGGNGITVGEHTKKSGTRDGPGLGDLCQLKKFGVESVEYKTKTKRCACTWAPGWSFDFNGARK